jgi:hypothetical protein
MTIRTANSWEKPRFIWNHLGILWITRHFVLATRYYARPWSI